MGLVGKAYAVLEKFEFDRPPVGVKFLAGPPDKLGRLDEKPALCEMLKRAQEGRLCLDLKYGSGTIRFKP